MNQQSFRELSLLDYKASTVNIIQFQVCMILEPAPLNTLLNHLFNFSSMFYRSPILSEFYNSVAHAKVRKHLINPPEASLRSPSHLLTPKKIM